VIQDPELTVLSLYIGGMLLYSGTFECNLIYNDAGAYQQTTSGLAITNQDCYELGKACFSIFGFSMHPQAIHVMRTVLCFSSQSIHADMLLDNKSI